MRDLAVVVSNSNTNVTPIETMDSIKKAGFKKVFIQWYNKDLEISQQEQLNYARKIGLEVIFVHLGYKTINDLWDVNGDYLVDYYKNDLKICKENNIPMVIMHLTRGKTAPNYNAIGLNRLKEIVNYAENLNIKVAFENTKIKGYLDYVIKNIHNKNVGICYDSGHCHVHFNDEFDYVLYKDRIFAIHFHDNDKSDDLHLIPFDGTIDWENVINKMKECNYEGPVTMELVYRYDYLNTTLDEFYKKGYNIGQKLANMFE